MTFLLLDQTCFKKRNCESFYCLKQTATAPKKYKRTIKEPVIPRLFVLVSKTKVFGLFLTEAVLLPVQNLLLQHISAERLFLFPPPCNCFPIQTNFSLHNLQPAEMQACFHEALRQNWHRTSTSSGTASVGKRCSRFFCRIASVLLFCILISRVLHTRHSLQDANLFSKVKHSLHQRKTHFYSYVVL